MLLAVGRGRPRSTRSAGVSESQYCFGPFVAIQPGARQLTRMLSFSVPHSPSQSSANVHRHAESPSVDVRFASNEGEARLEVRDYGKRIDSELFGRLNNSGAGAGIGLAGIRERLRELGGTVRDRIGYCWHSDARGDSKIKRCQEIQ